MFNKKLKIAVILVTVLTLSMVLQVSQVVKAQTHVQNFLYVSVAPNPVGVGQEVYISMFFTKPLPPEGATFGEGFYHGLTLEITDPDGHTETSTYEKTDSTGGIGGIQYIPETTGEYKVKASYDGETFGEDIILDATESPEVTFVVQDEKIAMYSSPPLPTEYWSRPIYATNYGWGELGGNWWGLGRPSFMNTGGYDATGNNFNAYTEAPNSAHVMWTKPIAFGGQVGLPINSDQESQYTSTSILYHQFEPIILNGILYFDHYPNIPNVRPGRMAIDVRTGETLWTQEYKDDTLAFGMVLKFHTIQEYGSQTWLWAMGRNENGYLYNLYDPMTGTYVCTVENLTSSLVGLFGSSPSALFDTSSKDPQGNVLIHWMNGTNLVMWNSTKCLHSRGSTIRPSGNIAFERGIEWEVPIATEYNGEPVAPSFSLAAKTPEGILFESHGSVIPLFLNQFGAATAIDVAYDAYTGEQLWSPKTRTLAVDHELNVVAAGEGYYVRHDKDTNEAYGYSMTNGAQLWGPVQLTGNALSTLARGAAIAYGKVYFWDFGGYVSAINLETGNIEWSFTRGSAGYGNPYGVYPIWHFGSHSIADEKLFLSEGRMYDPPLFANARKLAINTTTGELVWSVLGFFGRNTGVIADGYLLGYNSYDCQIYTMGKGQTATTITVQDDWITEGNGILVKGMVTDESPGTKDSDRLARFPNGVPAICDDNQSAWMEYVYMQQPKPTEALGVDVTIAVLDPNGNCYTVATTTSDVNGFYSATFIPEVPGKYTVYAQFSGSESYWPSSAVTAINVESAPEPTPVPTATPAPMTDAYVLGLGGASIAAIIAIGLVLILMLRKR